MKFLKSFTFVVLAGFFFWGISRHDLWVLFPVGLAFVGVPLLDALIGVSKESPSSAEKKKWSAKKFWMPSTFIYALSHFVIILYGASQLSDATWSHLLLQSLTVGIYTGGIGITVAHELLHRSEKSAKFTADLLLASVCYQHFAVEHIFGHHFQVATPQDPATSRAGETVYQFLLRSLRLSYLHAWEIENKRLGANSLSIQNRVLRGHTLSIFFLFVIAALFGVPGALYFLAQSVIAFTTLEFVNYIEHYGLYRRQLENGRFEKVTIEHSWNSSYAFSNALLFNLQRHSDHHANMNLPFTVLSHHDDAPQLPSGYPAMIALAVIPRLWFRVMDPRLESWRRKNMLGDASIQR